MYPSGNRKSPSEVPLLPLRHKDIAAILRNKLLTTNLHLLRLPLQPVVCAKCVQISLSAIKLTSLAELAQSKKTVGGQMMDLKLKHIKHLA
jgi:hypothetical protein